MLKRMIHKGSPDHLELTLPFLPKLVMDRRVPKTLEEAAFSSGAAIVLLQQTMTDPALNVPRKPLKIVRRSADEGEIRDGFLLTEPGSLGNLSQAMGPSGFMYAQWRDHTLLSPKLESFWTHFIGTIPLYTRSTMIEITEAEKPECSPVSAVVQALQDVLTMMPKEEMLALQWADITLSLALGWKHMLPLVGASMTSKELKVFRDGEGGPDELLIKVHTAIARSARDAIRMSHDLARRAAKMRTVAPKLRSKGSEAAVALFLSEDALSPSSLAGSWMFRSKSEMSPRSARRFCDRLVELGVVKELTGRSTFRLYGIAS